MIGLELESRGTSYLKNDIVEASVGASIVTLWNNKAIRFIKTNADLVNLEVLGSVSGSTVSEFEFESETYVIASYSEVESFEFDSLISDVNDMLANTGISVDDTPIVDSIPSLPRYWYEF